MRDRERNKSISYPSHLSNMNDYEIGKRDAINGIYDKWYRYHRIDDGALYDKGFAEGKKIWEKRNRKNETATITILEG